MSKESETKILRVNSIDGWINMAKRARTIYKRVEESIRLLEKGEELGLK